MKNVVGNIVEGDDFFDREGEQNLAWRKLRSDNQLLLAARRVGKSSFMKRLVATAEKNGFSYALETSFAKQADEMECMLALLEAVNKQLAGKDKLIASLSKVFTQIKGFKVSANEIRWDKAELKAEDWRKAGEGIANALNNLDGQVLICIDEVPLFILHKLLDKGSDAGVARTRDFLNWFRQLRQDYSANVRWMLAGSIGLDTITQRYNLTDTINDLELFPLGAFSVNTANRFLQQLGEAEDMPLDDDTRTAILEHIDWPLPYYLQVVFSKLRDRQILEGKAPNADRVVEVVEELLSPQHNSYFDYWRQRLYDELGQPDAGHAIHLLNQVARDPHGVSDDVLQQALRQKIADPNRITDDDGRIDQHYRYLKAVLLRDGYLVDHRQEGQSTKLKFQLSLLRIWWTRQ